MITVKEMQQLERHARSQGVFADELMENAGKEVARVIKERYHLKGKHLIIFAGSGDNGGDGLVAARYLSKECTVIVLLFASKQKLNGNAKENYEKIKSTIPIIEIKDPQDLTKIRIQPTLDLILIDALIGTGLNGPPQALVKQAIEYFNSLNASKISIDIPSGIDPDLGETQAPYCQSDLIIALHDLKVGLQNFQEKSIIIDIGIPKS